MNRAQHLASLGRSAIALIDEMDADQTISHKNREHMVADELRELVRLCRQVLHS